MSIPENSSARPATAGKSPGAEDTSPAWAGLTAKVSAFERLAQRFQGQRVLSIARLLFLAGAAGSLLAVGGGLIVALLFHFQTGERASQERVPPPVVTPSVALDMNTVSAHLQPPTNITVRPAQAVISSPLTTESILGFFNATTLNGLASYPDDIVILGGSDAALFTRARQPFENRERTVLRPSAVLMSEINRQLSALIATTSRPFNLQVVARDTYGNASEPADVTLTLTFGPAPSQPVAVASPPPEPELTGYRALARDIALAVDPNYTPVFARAYQRGLQVPAECRVNENNANFVRDARNAFEAMKSRLTAANVEGFYVGLCSAWQAARNEEQQAVAAGEQARNAVILRNNAARATTSAAAAGARFIRNVVLGFVGAALLFFLAVSALLALLAIENHSKAMRDVIETLSARTRV